MYLEHQIWSPASIPTLGPTWYSHYMAITRINGDKHNVISKRRWETGGWDENLARHNLSIGATDVNSGI